MGVFGMLTISIYRAMVYQGESTLLERKEVAVGKGKKLAKGVIVFSITTGMLIICIMLVLGK